MIIFLSILSIYIITSIILYVCMDKRCKTNRVFKAPKYSFIYYLLSFTWGLPFTLIGCIVAFILICTGRKPVKYGWNWYFEIEGIDWGLNLGLFIIVPKECGNALRNHEHGHGIQNTYFGIFTPAIVAIPSAIRFWYIIIKQKKNKMFTYNYDDIWFEGSATESGNALLGRLKK